MIKIVCIHMAALKKCKTCGLHYESLMADGQCYGCWLTDINSN